MMELVKTSVGAQQAPSSWVKSLGIVCYVCFYVCAFAMHVHF